ncbi:MAG: hypothetical protein LBR85_08245 [Oscillospiraceae bacterium]|jgi:hypothetical protein|nr:hypothetical protein [Oscillospiraceae bacterium]
MKTKLLVCTLAFLLLLGLAGCAGKSAAPDGGGTHNPTETAPPAQPAAYEKGIITETGFESEYFGLRFTPPEDFAMSTAEEIDAMMNLGAEITGLDFDYSTLTTVYEMMATSLSSATNVIIMAEKPTPGDITADQYLELMKVQLPAVPEMNYVVGDEITSVEIAGETYKKLTAEGVALGFTLIQDYHVRKVGDRLIFISISYSPETEGEVKILLDAFSAY